MKVSIMNENVECFKQACAQNSVEPVEFDRDADFVYFTLEDDDLLTFRVGVDYGIRLMSKELLTTKP